MEFITSTLGLNIAAESKVNKKTGLFLNTEISFWENIKLNARLEGIAYKDHIDNSLNYNELLFNIVLNFHW